MKKNEWIYILLFYKKMQIKGDNICVTIPEGFMYKTGLELFAKFQLSNETTIIPS